MRKDMKKSLHKAIMKMKSKKPKETKEIVEDIVEDIADANNIAEVDPDEIPPTKENVLNKSESGINKLKIFLNKK